METGYRMRVLGHVSLGITDLVRSAAFYDAALGALGYARVWTGDNGLGYGSPGREQLNLFLHEGGVETGRGFHLAFEAPDPAAVHAFHAAALDFGGASHGAPGPRPHVGPSYYAAFVTDPDGHRLEAVYQERR